jgi:hypothetical protein
MKRSFGQHFPQELFECIFLDVAHEPAQVLGSERQSHIGTGSFQPFFGADIAKDPLSFDGAISVIW